MKSNVAGVLLVLPRPATQLVKFWRKLVRPRVSAAQGGFPPWGGTSGVETVSVGNSGDLRRGPGRTSGDQLVPAETCGDLRVGPAGDSLAQPVSQPYQG